jgi:3D (Asp-Asp-Asp) domain-containing protein
VIASGPDKGKPKRVGITASGTRARRGTLAADTRYYPFGTVMFVPGYGYGRVEDRGGAIRGEHIDVFFRSRRRALEWGRQTLPVRIWLPSGRPGR